MNTLEHQQQRMKRRHSGEVALHRRKRMSRRAPEWIGPKTRRHFLREDLETTIRDLRARLDHFEELRREQHEERKYATEITYVTPLELSEMSRYQR